MLYKIETKVVNMYLSLTNRFWVLLLSVFVGMNILLTVRISRQKNEYVRTLHLLDKQMSYQLNVAEDVIHAYLFQLRCSGTPLTLNLILTDPEESIITLGQLTENKPFMFFFRFYTTNCLSCVETQMVHLIELAQQVGKDHIAVLSDYDLENLRWLSLKYPLCFFKINSESFDLDVSVENLRCHYFFACRGGTTPIKAFPLIGNLEGHTHLFFKEALNIAGITNIPSSW